jgi:hypothetical protein
MALAVLMAAALWAVVSAGPALAVNSGGHASVVHAAAQAPVPETAVITVLHDAGNAPELRAENMAVVDKAAAKTTQKTTPKGSPLGVQLATIAVLLALGFGYFKVMGRTGRRTSPRKPE